MKNVESGMSAHRLGAEPSSQGLIVTSTMSGSEQGLGNLSHTSLPGIPSGLTFDVHHTPFGDRLFVPTSSSVPKGFGRNGTPLLRPINLAAEAHAEISPRETAEKPLPDPRENLRKYRETGPRIDLESEEIADMLAGVGRFKEYNIHEQVDSNKETGAVSLGEGAFRVPNKDRYPFLFLHDSFYMSKADQDTPEGRALVESALDKFANLYDTYGLIPNFAATPSLNATALPLFIPTAWEWYQSHPDKDSPAVQEKFRSYMEVGADELQRVWNNPKDLQGAIGTYHHVISADSRLRKPGDRDAGYATNAGREWFWDFSSVRGAGSEHRLAPVCLNSIIARNEEILAQATESLGLSQLGGRDAETWRDSSNELKAEINQKLYNPRTRTYHDYDYVSGEQREESTLAAVWTLWGGVTSGEQAVTVLGNLARLDSDHGLLVTAPDDKQSPISADAYKSIGLKSRYLAALHELTKPGNWDENTWPPISITVKEAILRQVTENAKISDADKLLMVQFGIVQAQNETRTQVKIFQENGIFPEKWDKDGKVDDKFYHYEPQQNGLGWGATLAELNVTRFLPKLYALEDQLKEQLGDNTDVVKIPVDIFTAPATAVQPA